MTADIDAIVAEHARALIVTAQQWGPGRKDVEAAIRAAILSDRAQRAEAAERGWSESGLALAESLLKRAALTKRAETAEAERDELRRVVDSECPIGALDLVTSLRVEKAHMMERLEALETWAQGAISYLENRYNIDYDTMQDQWQALEIRLRALAAQRADED